jgi:predicted Zn-dependent protease
MLPAFLQPVGRFVWGSTRHAPWPVKVMLAIIVVGGPAAVAIKLGVRQVRTQRFGQLLVAWKEFEDGVRAGDEAQMAAALDAVLATNPAEPTALGRKRALETGEADPADQPMVVLSVRRHLKAGRLADAAREAQKRLAAEPADWLARCVVAADLLQRGDQAAAAAELDKLPAPNNQSAKLDPGGLLFAARLFRATGKDPLVLRRFCQSVIQPILKSPGAASLGASEKVGLLECYAEAFDPPTDQPQPGAVAESWAVAAQLADAALDEALEEKDAAVLARIGRLGPALEVGLGGLRRGRQVTDAEHAPLLADLRDRTRRAWEAVAPDGSNPEATRGYVATLLRSIDAVPPDDRPARYDQARTALVKGIEARPDDPELAQMFSRLLTLEGRPLQAAERLIGLANKYPDRPVWWALAAEAAAAANRRDVAIQACAKLRERDPNNSWAARTEARLWVEAGEADKALAVLGRFDAPTLLKDGIATYTYTRALAEGHGPDAADRLTAFLKAVEEHGQVVPAVAAARGLADAAGYPPEQVADRLGRLLARHPDQPDLLKAKADAAYRAAEAVEPIWEIGRVRAALRAVEQARIKLPADLDLVTQLGWLHLAGEDSPVLAGRAVAPLKAAADDPARTARQLELLGAVALGENDVAAAVKHLERAARAPDPPAGVFVLLAKAYHASGQRGPARAALESARNRPRTPREQAVYLTTARVVAP